MRVIIFDRELHEPLTIVEVPHKLAEEAKSGRPIHLMPPPPPFRLTAKPEKEPEFFDIKIVTLTFERVMRGDSRTGTETLFWYAYANDPETALLLRATFLPGQLGEVRRREKEAYVKGIFRGAGFEL